MKNKLLGLQVLRGLAAVYVALYHTMVISREQQYAESEFFESFSIHGYLGVNFFFVLSGFIILHAHAKDISVPTKVFHYLRKRFVRVYPIYWVYLTLYIIASYFGLGQPDFSWDIGNLLNAYSLSPPSNTVSLPLKVAWTLLHEILFYLVFCALIINLYLGLSVFAIWLLTIIFIEPDTGNFARIFYEWNLYFFIGMACFLLSKKATIKHGYIALALSGLVLGYYFINYSITIRQLNTEFQHLHYILAPTFGLLVFSLVVIEKHRNFKFPKILILLGDASYSIYLVHSAVISLAFILLQKFYGSTQYADIIYFLIFVSSVIGGTISYLLFEKPLFKRLR